MKIGLDATPLVSLQGGIGFYLFHLLDALIPLLEERQFFLYAPTEEGEISYFKKYPNVQIRVIPFWSRCHSLWGQTTLSFFCYYDQIDVFWGTTQSIPLGRRKQMKTLFVLYDFVYLFYPKTIATIKRLFQSLLTGRMLEQADRCLSISQATAQQLHTLYPSCSALVITPPSKPLIKKEPVEHVMTFLRGKGLCYKSYLITVGTLEPRKNLRLLLQHYLALLSRYPLDQIFPLVIIGGGGWKNRALLEELAGAQRRYPSHVLSKGRVSDQELSLYLTGARELLSLSCYEGYGMPLQEARLCGTPIIALDRPEAREAAEEDGTFLSLDQLADALKRVFLKTEGILPSSVLETHYPSNQKKAEVLRDLFNQLCECRSQERTSHRV